jgi:hypothetical protein
LTSQAIVCRLFALALQIAERESASGYIRIAEVKGTFSWSFLEHLSEISREGGSELLHALVKRRFAMEGVRSDETALFSVEQLAVEYWLKHNNSRHGARLAPFLAFSEHEEMFMSRKSSVKLASKDDIRDALRSELKAATPIKIEHDTRREIRWHRMIGNGLRVSGWVDLGKSGEQAASFLVAGDAERALHVPTSFLGIMGIGESSWEFLEEGEEKLCSSATIRFFDEVCEAMAEAPE